MLCLWWGGKQNAFSEQSFVALNFHWGTFDDAFLCMVVQQNKNASFLFAKREKLSPSTVLSLLSLATEKDVLRVF